MSTYVKIGCPVPPQDWSAVTAAKPEAGTTKKPLAACNVLGTLQLVSLLQSS